MAESKDIKDRLYELRTFSDISTAEMADKLGVSMRTYQDWRLGNSMPQAALAIFKMLGELDEDDAIRLIKRIVKDSKDA